MQKYLKLVFAFFLFIAFLFEGLGVNNGREVAYSLILILPFFLFAPFILSNNRKSIHFPVKLSLLWSFFLIFSTISSLFGLSIANSFENLFLYVSLFFVFIFVYNNKELIEGFTLNFIILLSFIFSIFSLFINFFVKQNSIISIPIDLTGQGYQFIYSVGGHNHLGDFLLLPLTFLILKLSTEKFKLENLLLFVFFLPYFIFSYSRSAYLDLGVVVVCIYLFLVSKKLRIKKIFYALASIFIIGLFILLLSVPSDNKKPSLFNSIHDSLIKSHDLSEGKTLIAGRNAYLSEGLYSFASNPFFGVGPGNFEYASRKYMNNPLEYSPSSHNFFFDVFVENGLLAGIFFLLLIIQVLHSIKIQLGNSEKVIFILFFLIMLLNFMTDYTFLIHSFLLLFFVFAALIYEEKSNFSSKYIAFIISISLFVVFNFFLLSNIAVFKGEYKLAFYLNPLNKDVYPFLINQEMKAGDKNSTLRYLKYYITLFRGDSDVSIFAGKVYLAYSNKSESVKSFDEAFNSYSFLDPSLVRSIYYLKLDTESKTSAKSFAGKYFSRLSRVDKSSAYYQIYYGYRLAALKTCREIYDKNCPYSL